MNRKLIFSLLGILFAIPLITVLIVSFFVATQTGSELLLSQLQRRNILTYQELRGSVSEGLRLRRLSVHTQDGKITFENIELNTSLRSVLVGELRVVALRADMVTLAPSSASNEIKAEPFSWQSFFKKRQPLIPFNLILEEISIGQLAIVQGETEHGFEDIFFSSRISPTGIDRITLDLSYDQSQLKIVGFLSLFPKLRSELVAEWSTNLLPAHQRISGRLETKAERNLLAVNQQTEGDVESTISVDIHDWLEQPNIIASGAIASFHLPTNQEIEISGLAFQLEGTPSELQGSANGQAALDSSPALRELEFKVIGGLVNNRVFVTPLSLITASGEALFNGWFSWEGGQKEWQGTLASDSFAANRLHPQLPESLSGELLVHGRLDDALWLSIASNKLQGIFRNNAFQSTLAGEWKNNTLQLDQLNVTLDDAKLSVAGTADVRSATGRFQLDIPAFQQIISPANGSLTATGTIDGPYQQPSINASVQGRDIQYGEFKASALDINIDVKQGVLIAGKNLITLANVECSASTQPIHLKHLQLNAQDNWLSPQLKFTAASEMLNLELTTETEIEPRGVSGELKVLTLSGPDFGRYNLSESVTYQLQRAVDSQDLELSHWKFSNFCLIQDQVDKSQGTELCASGVRDGQNLSASVSATGLPLSLLQLVPEMAVTVEGELDLTASLSKSFKGIKGEASVTQNRRSNKLLVTLINDPNKHLEVTEFGTELTLVDQQFMGSINAKLNETGSLTSTINAGGFGSTDSPVTAEFNVSIPDLSPYTAISSDIDIPAGSLNSTILVGNTLQQPAISADAQLDIPHIYIHPLSMEWSDLSATILSNTEGELLLQATMLAGDGTLTLEGQATADNDQNWRSQLRVSGDKVLLMDQPTRKITSSPELTISLVPGQTTVTGIVTVPEAFIQFKPTPNRLSLTDDAVIYTEESELENSAWKTLLDVELILGENVHLEAFGLKTDVIGNLSLTQKPRSSLLGTGELNLKNGSYKAYGQDLIIDKGLIRFNGSLQRPEVDVKAYRQVNEVTAGLLISGAIDKLQSKLYSSPTLSDSEILSYIIRGRPLRESNAADSNMVANAALSYALEQSTPVTDKLADISGLDSVSITADRGVETLGIALGKHLSSDLYVRYGIGVIDKLSKLFAQYQISDKLFLETEIGEGQSIDLLYRVQ